MIISTWLRVGVAGYLLGGILYYSIICYCFLARKLKCKKKENAVVSRKDKKKEKTRIWRKRLWVYLSKVINKNKYFT